MTNEKETSDLIGQRKQRIGKVEEIRKLGIDPYPSKSERTHHAKQILDNYDNLQNEEVTVAGRLMSWRSHGQLAFAELQDQSGKIQLYIRQDQVKPTNSENENIGFEDFRLLDLGDFIQVTGIVTTTQSGEISIMPSLIRIASKTIRPLPRKFEDKEERFRRRYVDMTVDVEVRKRFERRAKFWQAHRDFFDSKGFSEVNVPILEHIPGGGDAVPFVTHMNAIDEDFYLRISHELPLKRLSGAGFEKVYDIGARFRNEGLSDEHLPEHVAMEFYWAYADWRDGMKFVQELYTYVLDKVYDGQKVFKIRDVEVDFGKEWEEIDFNKVMQDKYGIKDVYTITLDEVIKLLKENEIDFEEKTINIPRGVDSLWKKIRKTVVGPAFLINHPKYLSPLQKPSLSNPNMVERFQPIIAGSELGNGWSEVNDPIDQYVRFLEQQKMRDSGDAEAQWLDIDYVEMLEYGMPPTFGYGHSERVFWFLENVTAREGVPFPQLKFHISDTTKKIYPEIDFSKIRQSESSESKKANAQSSKPSTQSKTQDFDNRIAIVINKDLENWQIANAISHISAYLGHKLDEKFGTGENFVTKDGKNHPRNSQYAIVILAANPGQMANFMQKVRESGLLYHGFIKEMIETTNDNEITEILAEKSDAEIEYLGVGIFGDNETLRKLTNKFSLYK
jgi:lysyl-tRNA synthetase class 2